MAFLLSDRYGRRNDKTPSGTGGACEGLRYDLARTRRTSPPKAVVRVVVEEVVVVWRMERSCPMRAHHVNRALGIDRRSVERLPGFFVHAAYREQRHRIAADRVAPSHFPCRLGELTYHA